MIYYAELLELWIVCIIYVVQIADEYDELSAGCLWCVLPVCQAFRCLLDNTVASSYSRVGLDRCVAFLPPPRPAWSCSDLCVIETKKTLTKAFPRYDQKNLGILRKQMLGLCMCKIPCLVLGEKSCSVLQSVVGICLNTLDSMWMCWTRNMDGLFSLFVSTVVSSLGFLFVCCLVLCCSVHLQDLLYSIAFNFLSAC